VYIRVLQQHMEKELGQPLIIENKGGANGYIGTEAVAKAKPDGYTLLFNVSSSIVMGPLTSSTARFDVQRDFAPITDVFDTPIMLVARNGLPVKTLDELIAYAKANPGKVNYGSPGHGSVMHLQGETFARVAGLKLTHVPYRGFAPAVQDLLGEHLDTAFISSGTIRPNVLAGQVRPIAIDRGATPPDLPPVPDLTKAVPGFETISVFAALWAPAGTPKAIIDRLNRAAVNALRVPELRAKVEEGGQIARGASPEQLAAKIAETVAVSKRLVDAAKADGVRFE
jgi:tripartite-type tricarboxylate transporter receptor subunit TctC